MNTPLSFTVIGCKNCPLETRGDVTYCKHVEIWNKTYAEKIKIRAQNYDEITISCPMWDKTKESKTK